MPTKSTPTPSTPPPATEHFSGPPPLPGLIWPPKQSSEGDPILEAAHRRTRFDQLAYLVESGSFPAVHELDHWFKAKGNRSVQTLKEGLFDYFTATRRRQASPATLFHLSIPQGLKPWLEFAQQRATA